MTIDSLIASVKRMLAKIPRNKYTYGAGIVIILALGWMVFGGNNKEVQTLVVEAKPFVQQVSVSGKVEAAEDVDMTFEVTGRVNAIHVEVGQKVVAGAPLVSLSSGTLAAQLASAQADVTRQRIERENSGVNLDEVRDQQETKVESAYRTLLSDDLEATAQYNSYGVTAPVITGLYNGAQEGTYKLRVEQADDNTGDFELYVFDLETPGGVKASKTGPTKLGTKGLFVSFPNGIAAYKGTTWYVSVPNEKSASYFTNYNAYQEALRERDRAIAEAEAELEKRSEGLTIADAALASAQAEVARVLAELSKYTLRAPFDGVVTAIDANLGGTASVSEPAVSVIGDGGLEIESYVPEINISYLEPGDAAVITLDAYGESVPFPATVAAIDPAETVRDGVSTYRVRLQFVEEDERVKSGMTANIVITTDERESVISVPQGIVKNKNGKHTVKVQVNGKNEERVVMTGLISSLGEIEITSGLEVGETVVLEN